MMQATTSNKTTASLRWRGLSKNDTTVLKGVCIALIVLHNFFHSFTGWRLENEFAFSPAKYEYFRTHLSQNLYNDVGLLFAFLGHYGVQMFVFLSAYGLYLSYRKKPLHYASFVRSRIWKLWPAFFLAVLFLIALTIITTRRLYHPDLYLGSLLRLSLLSNLVPGKAFDIVGPWWFYSMIVQFYLVFPLLRNWFNRYGMWPLVLLSVASWVLQIFFTAKMNALGWPLNTLVIGHLPVFCLGLVLAKYNDLLLPWWVFVAACVLFIFGNLYMPAWVFSQISITVIFLYVYLFLKRFFRPRQNIFRRVLLFTGNLSMYLFAVNGFLRHPFLLQVARHSNTGIKVAIVIGFLMFVTFVAILLRVAEKYFLKLVSPNRQQGAVKAV
jgi:peptidoglycan/LPS O-acetylase OafA/YrhL